MTRQMDPDFERAYGPHGTSVPMTVRVAIEVLADEDGARLRIALGDLLPVTWTWTNPDACGCFDGHAVAYLDPGAERAAERTLEAIIERFAPGYGMAMVWPASRL